ncbi:hypothetical protein Agub_g10088, partial [Astrephomene gubernaculifera]
MQLGRKQHLGRRVASNGVSRCHLAPCAARSQQLAGFRAQRWAKAVAHPRHVSMHADAHGSRPSPGPAPSPQSPPPPPPREAVFADPGLLAAATAAAEATAATADADVPAPSPAPALLPQQQLPQQQQQQQQQATQTADFSRSNSYGNSNSDHDGNRGWQGPPGVAAPLQPGRVLAGGKYTIAEVLGAGSNAVAYRALRPDGSPVALKCLSLRGLREWKALGLLQREAGVLAGLNHPGVPRCLGYLEEDTPEDRLFVLVQEVVEGKSLAAMLREGMRASEAEVLRIAGELLDVLEYLGGLRPPVIHRDVKPDNIILEGGCWGGGVRLVDFGGVQAAASAGELAGLGSTIVGTYGYMAPEQFRGAAEPASDLYGLGATLLHLVTGQPPSAFPQERMRIAWRSAFNPSASSSSSSSAASRLAPPSSRLGALLDGLLEPLAEERLTAQEARRLLLQGEEPQGPTSRSSRSGFNRRRAATELATSPSSYLQSAATSSATSTLSTAPAPLPAPPARPAGTRVQLQRSGGRLEVIIPPKGLTTDIALTGTFALAWNAFVAVWTVGAIASGGLLFAAFSAPFWVAGWQLAQGVLGGALMRERLGVGRRKWRLGRRLALLSG